MNEFDGWSIPEEAPVLPRAAHTIQPSVATIQRADLNTDILLLVVATIVLAVVSLIPDKK